MPGHGTLGRARVIVFGVLGQTSPHRNRNENVREYAAVPSIRRYIMVESTADGPWLLHGQRAGDPWTAMALTAADHLALPEIGREFPVSALYEGVDPPPRQDDGR